MNTNKTLILIVICIFSLSSAVVGSPNDPRVLKTHLFKEDKAVFRKNIGQWPGVIKYRSFLQQTQISFLSNSLSFCARTPIASNHRNKPGYAGRKDEVQEFLVWNINFAGANTTPAISETGMKESLTNYLIGYESSESCLNVPDFQSVIYHDLYRNIDLRYYTEDNKLKYDFIIGSNADLSEIEMNYDGILSCKVDDDGKLLVETAIGTLIEEIPYSYQFINGRKREVLVRYKVKRIIKSDLK